jgi:glycosyltransferase involved in cell wall biosynthesis
LVPLGVEPHVVLPSPGPQVSRYESVGARVYFAPMSILKRKPDPLSVASMGLRMARGVASIGSLIRQLRIDLVHTNMEVVLDGGLAAKALGLPHVMHYRGNTYDRPKLVFDGLTRAWTALSDRVFCISNGCAEIFRKRGLGEKVEVLYNPVDVTVFADANRKERVRQELGATEDQLLVGTVGRIHPRKNLETFIAACAEVGSRVPSARFVVVGAAEGTQENEYLCRLQRQAKDAGIAERLVFAGARRDMPQVMKALDVFVLCSRHEGFGRVVAEAMAGGRPVVVSDEGAMPELVEQGREGYRVSALDGPAFAERIRTLLADRRLAEAIGRGGAQSADKYQAREIARRILSTYRSLTGRKMVAGAETEAGA